MAVATGASALVGSDAFGSASCFLPSTLFLACAAFCLAIQGALRPDVLGREDREAGDDQDSPRPGRTSIARPTMRARTRRC